MGRGDHSSTDSRVRRDARRQHTRQRRRRTGVCANDRSVFAESCQVRERAGSRGAPRPLDRARLPPRDSEKQPRNLTHSSRNVGPFSTKTPLRARYSSGHSGSPSAAVARRELRYRPEGQDAVAGGREREERARKPGMVRASGVLDDRSAATGTARPPSRETPVSSMNAAGARASLRPPPRARCEHAHVGFTPPSERRGRLCDGALNFTERSTRETSWPGSS